MHSLHGYEPKVGMNADCTTRIENQPGIGFIPYIPFTAADYTARIELGFRACEWADDSPFRRLVAERLAAMGRLHCPSRMSDERLVMAEEDAVEFMRHLPEPLAEPVQPL